MAPPAPAFRAREHVATACDQLHLLTRTSAYLDALAHTRRMAAHADLPVLLEGESGTGKTLFARYLHAHSPRSGRPFVAVNLAALDDALASSELFGHVAGAFTGAVRTRAGAFAHATSGTLFLDEVGRASRAVQGKLLHAVEERRIQPLGSDTVLHADARIVAATSVSLTRLVAEDRLLLDLKMRLDGFTVRIPPLRERRGDIPLLVEALVEREAPRRGHRVIPAVDSSLMECLVAARWPGNVRQLEACVTAALVRADGGSRLTLAHCDESLVDREPAVVAHEPPRGAEPATSPRLSGMRLRMALAQEHGNRTKAARRLGVSRTTLYRWMEGHPGEAGPRG